MATGDDLVDEAIALNVEDICRAARCLFDLHPGAREFLVRISDDGEVTVSRPE